MTGATAAPGRLAALGLVFVGGSLGGATRIGVQQVFPETSGPLPWDLLTVNLLGSLLLAAAVAFAQARGPWRIFPAVGPGFFGGFTTFSAIACLHWSAETSPAISAAVLAVGIVACAVGAAVGWRLGDRPPTPFDEHAVLEEENE